MFLTRVSVSEGYSVVGAVCMTLNGRWERFHEHISFGADKQLPRGINYHCSKCLRGGFCSLFMSGNGHKPLLLSPSHCSPCLPGMMLCGTRIVFVMNILCHAPPPDNSFCNVPPPSVKLD